MPDFAANLLRLMARDGLTLQNVVERSGLDLRTVKGILSGEKTTPHARTLHKLAKGLGVKADELFQNPALLARELLDQEPHPVVCEVVSTHPDLFEGWSPKDFDALYRTVDASRRPTRERALEMVRATNQQREFFRKVDAIRDSDHGDTLAGIVDLLHAKLTSETK